MKKLNKRSNPSQYLKGAWNPQRIQIAREILKYPILANGTRGHIYNTGKIAAAFGVSNSAVIRLQYALVAGAIPPTDEEMALAEGKDVSIPINPNAHPEEVISEVPEQTEPISAVTEAPSSPEIKEGVPEVPPPTPAEMKEGVDKFLESVNHKAAAILPPGNVDHEDKRPPFPPKSADKPDAKAWQNPDPKQKEEPKTEKVAEVKETEIKEPEIAKTEKPNGKEKDKQVLVGGDLFGNVQKVKLTMGTLFWYFWVKNVYGYTGSMDDFLNWCVTDTISSRGLSLDVNEAQIAVKGGGDGK